MYRGLILYAIRLLGDGMSFMAEDCVQEAIMSTYANRSVIETPSWWRRYLLLCVKNNANMALRKRNAHSHYLEQLSFSNPEMENELALLRQETLDSLYAAVDSLPQIYRDVFILSFEEGLKISEVAKILDVAEITVKKRKSRLIDLLRGVMHISRADVILLLSSLSAVEA